MSKKHVDKTYSKLLSRMTLLNTNTVHLKHLSGPDQYTGSCVVVLNTQVSSAMSCSNVVISPGLSAA